MSANSSADTRKGNDGSVRLLSGLGITAWVIVAFFMAQGVILALLSILNFFGVSLVSLNPAVSNSIVTAMVYAVTFAIILTRPRLRKKPVPSRKLLGLHRLPDWKDIGLAPIAFVPYLLLAGLLLMVATYVLPGFDADQAQDVGFNTIARQFEYILAFLTLVVVVPVAEEVLFRGYLYGRLRGRLGLILSILLTSICFGFLHFQLNVAINVFALSIVLCGLREITGSIWAGIILHMIKNAIAFYALFIAPMLV